MKRSGALAVVLAGLAGAGHAGAQTAGREPDLRGGGSGARASAAPEPVILHWTAPAECPTGEEVLGDARTLAVQRGATPTTEPTVVEAVVEHQADGRWGLSLAIGAAREHVEAASCAQLARAGALFVALIIDSDGAPTGADTVPPPSPAAPAPPVAVAPSVKARGATREMSLLAGAGFVIDKGTLPRVEPLAALEVGVRYRRAEVSLQGTLGPAQDKPAVGLAAARLRPLSVLLAPCYAALAEGRFRFGPCARAELGFMHAEGLGVSQRRVINAAWLSLGGELAGWLSLEEHFEVRLGATLLVPVARPDFEFTGLGSVFKPGVAARADLAAVIRF